MPDWLLICIRALRGVASPIAPQVEGCHVSYSAPFVRALGSFRCLPRASATDIVGVSEIQNGEEQKALRSRRVQLGVGLATYIWARVIYIPTEC